MQPTHFPIRLFWLLRALLPAWLLLASAARAQVCYDRGCAPVAAFWEAGPDMGCAQAPGWPWWHMHTPEHHVLVAKPGFRPGDTRALPRILIAYRCTGWLLLPVVVDRVRVMGQVLDTAERPCVPPAPIGP